MKTKLIKIGIVVMPMFIMWSSGFVFATLMHSFDPSTMSLSRTSTMTISFSHQLPYFGSWIVLGLSIYLSIKLWLRYVPRD